MTSDRIALLSILTACMYAFSIFMQSHTWLFPFGLFRIGLFIVFILMLLAERKKPRWEDVLVLSWAALFAVSSNFILQFFFSEQAYTIHQLSIELFTSWALFGFAFLLLAWQMLLAWRTDGWTRWAQIAGGLGFFSCMLLNDFRLVCLPVALWFVALKVRPVASAAHQSIATVFFFIVLSAYISGFFFGMEEVLAYL